MIWNGSSFTEVTTDGTKNNGWRVLKKSGSGITGTVILIHASVPAVCMQFRGEDRSDSSNRDATYTAIENHCKNNYNDKNFASSARSVKYSDLNQLTTAGFHGIDRFYFWYATKVYDGDHKLYWYHGNRTLVGGTGQTNVGAYGVRPIVVLKSGIKTNSSNKVSFLGKSCWALKW